MNKTEKDIHSYKKITSLWLNICTIILGASVVVSFFPQEIGIIFFYIPGISVVPICKSIVGLIAIVAWLVSWFAFGYCCYKAYKIKKADTKETSQIIWSRRVGKCVLLGLYSLFVAIVGAGVGSLNYSDFLVNRQYFEYECGEHTIVISEESMMKVGGGDVYQIERFNLAYKLGIYDTDDGYQNDGEYELEWTEEGIHVGYYFDSGHSEGLERSKYYEWKEIDGSMEFLRFLEGIRTPAGDAFFSAVTHMGEETIFILVGLLFFWCIDKKKGYFILSVGFMGTVINQFLKLWFRIPRPWVKDPNFTIVESARAEATGYSFPSGHTQTAVGMYGGIARVCKNIWVRIICILLCVLVPLSRMYLGVHTPADVGVSIVVALILIFVLYPIVNKVLEKPKYMRIYLGVLIALAAVFLAFVLLYPFPADIDMHNYESGVKNAYKILGCILGLWVAYEIDVHYTHFETKGVWWVQILKLVPGLLILLAIKSGLKEPLYALLNGSFLADGIRYFLLTAVAGGVWPMTFKLWNKLDKKTKREEK